MLLPGFASIGGFCNGSPISGNPTVQGIREINAAPPSVCPARPYFPVPGLCLALQETELTSCPDLFFTRCADVVKVDQVEKFFIRQYLFPCPAFPTVSGMEDIAVLANDPALRRVGETHRTVIQRETVGSSKRGHWLLRPAFTTVLGRHHRLKASHRPAALLVDEMNIVKPGRCRRLACLSPVVTSIFRSPDGSKFTYRPAIIFIKEGQSGEPASLRVQLGIPSLSTV